MPTRLKKSPAQSSARTRPSPAVRAAGLARVSRTRPRSAGEPARFIPVMKALSVPTVPDGRWRLEVKLDGSPLDAAVLGTAVPVDPGKHTVEASAKGKKPWSTTIEVSEKNKAASLDIPPLEDEPVATAPPSDNKPKIEGPGNDEGGGSNMKIIGIAVGAVGLAGIGVGSFFGLRASSKWKEAKTHCNTSYECDATGVDLTDQARSSGNIATLGFVAGGALLVGGVVLFLTAPSGKPANKVNVGVGPGSLVIGGTF